MPLSSFWMFGSNLWHALASAVSAQSLPSSSHSVLPASVSVSKFPFHMAPIIPDWGPTLL